MLFTNNEAVDMIAVYFECLQNAALAQRVYRARYPNRHLRDARIFSRLVRNLRSTGSFRPQLRRHAARTTEDNIVNVLAYVELNPHVSTRAMSRALGLSRTTIINILEDHRKVVNAGMRRLSETNNENIENNYDQNLLKK
ncbi:transposable element tc3 transposase-like protein [Holotrichia oblita]|uniref:Transposable element tc3 transposase-like protein n=1 Tax=Holotrichia oblita TaxID=644536 RepID=A0ACB9SQ71_HOLOL|nr:transposable element tc3 transposase-like protein [Holotrichia oblita]